MLWKLGWMKSTLLVLLYHPRTDPVLNYQSGGISGRIQNKFRHSSGQLALESKHAGYQTAVLAIRQRCLRQVRVSMPALLQNQAIQSSLYRPLPAYVQSTQSEIENSMKHQELIATKLGTCIQKHRGRRSALPQASSGKEFEHVLHHPARDSA